MENILDLYCQPYNKAIPVICMDEKPYQLIDQVREPLAMKPGQTLKEDNEYKRNGTCSIFVFFEPLTGWCNVDAQERRTRADWAHQIRYLLEDCFPNVQKIRLVMDNLNTHTIAALYHTFPPELARSLAKRLEIHYTPKHGSWLNMAEILISVLSRQCLSRRIPTLEKVNSQITAWQEDKLSRPTKVDWQFTTADARIKLKHLYPVI